VILRVVAVTALLAVSVPFLGPPAVAAGPCAAPTVQGTSKAETLVGTEGPDVIAGAGGDDVLLGLGGDDLLCGGAGSDLLDGGPGDDGLYGGTDVDLPDGQDFYSGYGDRLEGGPGDDVLDPGADPRLEHSEDTVTFEHATGPLVVDLPAGVVTGEGTDTVVGAAGGVVGGPYDDVITGTDLADVLYGGLGSDRVSGGAGDDRLTAGVPQPEDAVVSDPAANVLLGGDGADIADGDDGNDLLRGGSGGDRLRPAGGADRTYGGTGWDQISDEVTPTGGQVLDGGAGRDAMHGLELVDRGGRPHGRTSGRIDMAAGTVEARIRTMRWSFAMPGFEIVSSPFGYRWTVLGTDGPDRIHGVSQLVRIHAGGGNDRIIGSDDDDVLDGGDGWDHGTGWGGRDRYVSVERITHR